MSDFTATLRELQLEERPALPTNAQLHAHARASVPRLGNDPPEAFLDARARIEALEAALAVEREELQGLIREAWRHGVGAATLARWSGYTRKWVETILEPERQT